MTLKKAIICRPGSADLFAAIEAELKGEKPVRIRANGHDVTDKMPLTAAELKRQRDLKGGQP